MDKAKPYQGMLRFVAKKKSVYGIVGFGLVLRVAVLIRLSRFPLFGDAEGYHAMAVRLLHGDSFAPYWPPGLPYFLSIVCRILGESAVVSRTLMLVFYIAFSIFVYLLVKEISDRKAANIAVLLFSLFPTYIHLSVEPLTQLPAATCLVALAYLGVLACRRPSGIPLLALGLFLGWATLIRPSSIFLVLGIPLYIFVKTKRIKALIIPFVVSVTIVSAWTVKVYKMTEHFVMINYANSRNLFIGNNPHTPLYKTWWFGSHNPGDVGVPDEYVEMVEEIKRNPPHVRDKLYKQAALDHILSRPDLFLLRTLNRTRSYFAFDTFSGAVSIKRYQVNKIVGLTVIGLDAFFYCLIMLLTVLFLSFPSTRSLSIKPTQLYLILGVAVIYAAPYWISFSHPTYHFPIMPLVGAIAAIFVETLVSKPKAVKLEATTLSARRKYAVILVLAVFVCIQLEWILVMYSRVFQVSALPY